MPASLKTEKASSMYPACEMLENASMRLTLSCPSAERLPMVIVAIARQPAMTGQGESMATPAAVSSTCPAPSASAKKRSSTAKPAALGPTERKAVTGVGAPSYTSGVHMWNGAALIL